MWKINNVYSKLRETNFFLLLFFLNLKFLFITVFEDRQLIVDIFVYVLLITSFLFAKLKNNTIFTFFVLLLLIVPINFSSYKLNVLFPLILMVGMSNLNFKNYLWYNLIIMGGTIIFMYVQYGTGQNIVTPWMTDHRRVRMNFGFSHPNAASLYYYGFVVTAMILLFYSKARKIYFIIPILFLPLILYIYNLTQTRSYLVGILILYITYYYYNFRLLLNRGYRIKYSKYFFCYALLILALFTLIGPFFKDQMPLVDKLFSYRLYFFKNFYDHMNISTFFFGTDWFDSTIIDSSYVHMIFEGGIFFFLIYLFVYHRASHKIVEKNDYFIVAIIASFLAYGAMESMLLYNMVIGNNLFWMILAHYYYMKRPSINIQNQDEVKN